MTRLSGHVLVVDDNADNRRLLKQLLVHAEHRVSLASDGAEALAAIAADRPDVVLLDLLMPNVDGFAVLERLQADQGPVMPVVVVTALDDRAQRLRALSLGAQEFLTKPVDGEELMVRLDTMLRLKATSDALAARTHALQSLNVDLQQANAGLVLSTEELHRLNEMRIRFQANLSHELRTPLTSIMGFVEDALDGLAGPLNPEQTRYLRQVMNSSEHLLGIITEMLDFAKLQTGKASLHLSAVSVSEILCEVESLMRPLVTRKQQTLVIECADGLPAVQADRTKLYQIMLNLTSNASKYTPDAGRIRLTADRDGENLRLTVSDTGYGIDPSDQPLLFEEFRQLVHRTAPGQPGTGLGLAITKRLVEMHGGSITVESVPQQGSTFTARIPL